MNPIQHKMSSPFRSTYPQICPKDGSVHESGFLLHILIIIPGRHHLCNTTVHQHAWYDNIHPCTMLAKFPPFPPNALVAIKIQLPQSMQRPKGNRHTSSGQGISMQSAQNYIPGWAWAGWEPASPRPCEFPKPWTYDWFRMKSPLLALPELFSHPPPLQTGKYFLKTFFHKNFGSIKKEMSAFFAGRNIPGIWSSLSSWSDPWLLIQFIPPISDSLSLPVIPCFQMVSK